MSSPRVLSIEGAQWQRHFLDACFLCKKPISKDEDIFMYRGDAPFCSEECRWQQIDMDEALESDRVTHTAYAAASTSSMKRKPTLIGVLSKRAGEKTCYDAETVATNTVRIAS